MWPISPVTSTCWPGWTLAPTATASCAIACTIVSGARRTSLHTASATVRGLRERDRRGVRRRPAARCSSSASVVPTRAPRRRAPRRRRGRNASRRTRCISAIACSTRHRFAIGPRGRHRVEGVAGGDDARLQRNRLAGQPIGIAAAVPALVRGAHDPPDLDHEAADLLEHLLALDRVRLDDRPLALVELAGLVDDLLRHGDLADVVQQRAELDAALGVVVQSHRLGDVQRQAHDALAVLAGVACRRPRRRRPAAAPCPGRRR